MPDKKLIQDAWVSYAEAVIPNTASPVQYQECKRAFFAGAAGVLNGLMRVLDPGEDVTPADEQRMANIQAELDEFVRTILKGK